LRDVVANKILSLAESQTFWFPKKFRAGYATARGPVLKITLAWTVFNTAEYLNCYY